MRKTQMGVQGYTCAFTNCTIDISEVGVYTFFATQEDDPAGYIKFSVIIRNSDTDPTYWNPSVWLTITDASDTLSASRTPFTTEFIQANTSNYYVQFTFPPPTPPPSRVTPPAIFDMIVQRQV
jgi:hypothetical protein